jgi:hypothetical protein
MRWLLLLLLAVIAGLLFSPAVAFAQTSQGVEITASGNVTFGCPSHLIITEVTEVEIRFSWNPPVNGTTVLRGAYGRAPESITDGFSVYEGNASTHTYWPGAELFIVRDVYDHPVIYRAWAYWGNGTYSDCYTEATLPAGGSLEDIATGLTSISAQMENIWDILSLWSLFVVPLLCAMAYQWRGSIIFAVPGFLSAWLAAPHVAPHGWHFAAPLVLLAVFIVFKLLYQAFTKGIKV